MNVYIWTDTPGIVTETYSFSGYSGSDDTVYNSIGKSGYKVDSVEIVSTGLQNSTLAGCYYTISYDTTRTYEGQLSLNIGTDNTGTYSGIRYRTGGSNIDEYRINSYLNYTTTNTFKMKFSRTGWELTINGNNLSGNYSSGMTNIIGTIMNSGNIQFRTNATRSTIGTQTVTVTYEQV